ncbi:hypothetical protein SETIT_6G168600v2 [Setaria italica]|uniref:Uncharacterized protein n=2 Tax=Setaria TaxID=4554 RepID=A0A368RMR9_SETIT|nr:hypothetical protein SETIT_6G168600v2 [Setaria italica]TKW10576.1 hypothetical protein SEVIR_6G174400v2 [Setaria viridis]
MSSSLAMEANLSSIVLPSGRNHQSAISLDHNRLAEEFVMFCMPKVCFNLVVFSFLYPSVFLNSDLVFCLCHCVSPVNP